MLTSSSDIKPRLIEGRKFVLEARRRVVRRRCLYDLHFLAELLYPPEDEETFGEFWKRYDEPQRWLLQFCAMWKSRAVVRVPTGFEVAIGEGGKKRVLPPGELVDLSQFTTSLIRQSRETLKTAIRRIDFIHDLMFFPFVKGMPAASAWFAHKLEMAERNSKAIKSAMCASDPFFDAWGGILVPEHRDPDKWGTKQVWSPPIHPEGVPEPASTFLAVKTRYEGGRYKSGHFDDLVTGEDRDSLAVREEKRRSIADRENERDRTQGTRQIQGTDHHPQDAYQTQELKRGTISIKLPCLAGSTKRFWTFWRMSPSARLRHVDEYTADCKPVFKHLPLLILAMTCDEQGRQLFSAQMLLDPSEGGLNVFSAAKAINISIDDVPEGLAGYLFCDPAFKRPENKFTGDYTAMGVVLWDKHGRRIIVDGAYRNDWGETDCFDEAARLIKMYRGIMGFYMEQKFLGDITEHWQTHAFANATRFAGILGLERAGAANKMTRIKALEPAFRAGRIVLVKGTPIAEAIEKEMAGYDAIVGPAENDDALDMVSQSFDPVVGAPLFAGVGFQTSGTGAFGSNQVQSRAVKMPGNGGGRWRKGR